MSLNLSIMKFTYAQFSSRYRYNNALEYFSLAEGSYSDSEYDEAYKLYDKAELEAQYSREAEQLTTVEDEKMLNIIYTVRNRHSQIYEYKRKLDNFVIEHKIAIGMTKEQVRASWGEPSNRSSFSSTYGITEDWIYGDCLRSCNILHFDKKDKLVNFSSHKTK